MALLYRAIAALAKGGAMSLFGVWVLVITGWPDVVVATIMAILALQGAATVIMHAMTELRSAEPVILAAAKPR
jgi:Co/Zn/Cd efflux system component